MGTANHREADSEDLRDFLVKQYMAVHYAVMDQVERKTGKRPDYYKRLEMNLLEDVFGSVDEMHYNGIDFMARLISLLIVNQALPNTNHRTTLEFANGILIRLGYKMDTSGLVDYINDSKHILEKGYKDYRVNHYKLTEKMLTDALGAQSGRLAMMDSKSIIDSLKQLANSTGTSMSKH